VVGDVEGDSVVLTSRGDQAQVADCLLLNELTAHEVVPEHDADRYLDVERAPVV
jgi:hypothetical protein